MRFKVPTNKCTVIKNAVEAFPEKKFERKEKLNTKNNTPNRIAGE